MQVGTLSLQHIFEKDVHYRVPLYQRPYVWTESEQWQPLWDDLRGLAEVLLEGEETRSHFMGASVQEKPTVPPGSIETRLLIDGQQRLTTLQLLLKAFEHVAVDRQSPNYIRALGGLVRNDYALKQEPCEDYKILPTNADRPQFDAIISAADHAEARENLNLKPNQRYTESSISDAYLFFYSAIDGWIGPDTDTGEGTCRIAALFNAIRDKVRLVVIDLDEKDDAQMIFETLNARGTPLLAADLVKNSLLGSFKNEQDAERAYERYWIEFDQDAAFWRALVGRGHARRARVELFLRHALSVMAAKDVAAGHLYGSFQEYAASEIAGNPTQQMKLFQRYGAIYRKFQDRWGDDAIDLVLDRLRTMDYETVYPLLLVLFDRLGGEAERLKLAVLALDSYLVRRMVCRLNTRGYDRLFVEAAALVNRAQDPLQALLERLRGGDAESDRWPDDGEFRKAWVEYPLYENLLRPRMRMLLEEMERASRTKFAESTWVPKNLTVEHIMPQTWQPFWPLPGRESELAEAEARNRLVHTIGNLTLLNEKLNPVQSNNAWVSDDGRGKRAGLKQSCTLFLNKALVEAEEWNEAAIRERGEQLFELACRSWRAPNGEPSSH